MSAQVEATRELLKAKLEEILEYAEGFWGESGPIDWDDLLYRIEEAFGLDLGMDMLSPEIRYLQRKIREARRKANE